MSTCGKCGRRFPDHLVQSVPTCIDTGGAMVYRMLCPICTLSFQNIATGSHRLNFSEGSNAQALLEEARRYAQQEESER